MTRYLDREPQVGDRVHVEFEGTFVKRADFTRRPLMNDDAGMPCSVPLEASVRVIAPEPKVGDVVTADMDLPEGSIIEFNSEHDRHWSYNLAYRTYGRWNTSSGDDSIATSGVAPHWRIVRIGGVS